MLIPQISSDVLGGDNVTVIAPGLPNIEFGFGLQYPITDGYILNGNINAAENKLWLCN